MGQRGNPHGHPLALLSLGRAGGGEADADHLVDGSEQPELGKTLKVSAGRERGRGGSCQGFCLVWFGDSKRLISYLSTLLIV